MKSIEIPATGQLVHLVYGDLDLQAEWINLLEPRSLYCQVHGPDYEHRPRPLRLVLHHVWPLGMGGPDTPDNWIVTCDTGHYNMHRLLGDLLRSQTMRTYGTDNERAMALRAYRKWIEAGKPGSPVYEVM